MEETETGDGMVPPGVLRVFVYYCHSWLMPLESKEGKPKERGNEEGPSKVGVINEGGLKSEEAASCCPSPHHMVSSSLLLCIRVIFLSLSYDGKGGNVAAQPCGPTAGGGMATIWLSQN